MCHLFLLYVIMRCEKENDCYVVALVTGNVNYLVSLNEHALDQIVVNWCITVVLAFVN